MTETDQTPKPRMSRGLRIVFGLSLALNLLVVAAIGGAWLRHGGPPGADIPRGGVGHLLYRELPREDQRALRRHVRQSLDRNTMRHVRVAPHVVEALQADPFDLASLEALLSQQSSALKVGQDVMRANWLKIIAEMSPEDRLSYAERLNKALKSRRAPEGG